MAQPNAELEPVEYDQVARVTQPPLGRRRGLSASQVAEYGASMGALGVERGGSTAMLNELQEASTEVWLRMLPRIMELVNRLQRARLNRLMQSVRGLPDGPVAYESLWSRLAPRTTALPSYIDRAEVLRLIAVAMEELPVTRLPSAE